jgi:hypothetical protein
MLSIPFLNVKLNVLRCTVTKNTHCKENPIYVFLFWESRGLSVCERLINSRIGPNISLQQNRQTDTGNI